MHIDTHTSQAARVPHAAHLGGHAVAGVENGTVVILRSLVQTVATGFAVPHLSPGTKERCCLRTGCSGLGGSHGWGHPGSGKEHLQPGGAESPGFPDEWMWRPAVCSLTIECWSTPRSVLLVQVLRPVKM